MAGASYDVVVIGGGPGGYPAAIRARQLGLSVALVEREHLGGICLNWGCIPTKALLRSSEVGHILSRLSEFGYSASEIHFDIDAVVKRSRKISKRLATGVKALLKKNKVDVFEGSARLAAAGSVLVEKDGQLSAELEARNVVLATGARARSLPGLEPDGKIVWTYKEAMVPESMPASLLVVGAGAIGMEFASFYRDLGAEVTVVEALPKVLPVEDAEISAHAQKRFERQGIRIHVDSVVKQLDRREDGASVLIESAGGETLSIEAERVILAVGIEGNFEDLGLEGTAVKIDRTHVVTNEWMETGEPGIYAVGDLTGPPWLAHKATHEGILVAERIAGVPGAHPLNKSRIPGCTYCRPQVASVGLTEEAARAEGYALKIGRFPFVGNGKAIALGESDGLVKTIFDETTGELLGAHMIGAEVTELIQGFVLAMNLETTEAELMQTVFAHPTLSEMMHESVLEAWDQAIHI
jgi:dihydrolipoamide dehydrogenase